MTGRYPSQLARENVDHFDGILSGLSTPLLLLPWYKIVRTFFFAPSIEFHPSME